MPIPKSLINQAKVDASQVNFQVAFNKALEAVDDPMRTLAMEMSSSGASESHNWLGTVPGFSEWTDQRKVKSLRAENILLVNKDFGSGIEIGRNDILDDRLGNVMARINQLADKAGLHYGQLCVEAMIAGFSATGNFGAAYDGAAYFSATHQDGGPIQSNTAGGAALSSASYFAGRASMWSLTDDEGDPLGIKPDTLIVGPGQEELGLQLTQADLVASGGAGVTNVAKRTANLMVSPRLVGAAANHWFLASMASAARPMILQIREAIFSDFDDNQNWSSKKLRFGAQGRHAVGYGLWQTCYGSNA